MLMPTFLDSLSKLPSYTYQDSEQIIEDIIDLYFDDSSVSESSDDDEEHAEGGEEQMFDIAQLVTEDGHMEETVSRILGWNRRIWRADSIEDLQAPDELKEELKEIPNALAEMPTVAPIQDVVEIPTTRPTKNCIQVSKETFTKPLIPVGSSLQTLVESPNETSVESPIEDCVVDYIMKYIEAPIEAEPSDAVVEVPKEELVQAPVKSAIELLIESLVDAPIEAAIDTLIQTPTQSRIEIPTEAPIAITERAPTTKPLVKLENKSRTLCSNLKRSIGKPIPLRIDTPVTPFEGSLKPNGFQVSGEVGSMKPQRSAPVPKGVPFHATAKDGQLPSPTDSNFTSGTLSPTFSSSSSPSASSPTTPTSTNSFTLFNSLDGKPEDMGNAEYNPTTRLLRTANGKIVKMCGPF